MAWIGNLLALRAAPSEYGTDVDADIGKWMVAGLTGLGTGASAPDVSEAYSIGGVPNTASGLYKTIDCVTLSSNASGTGTNLSTPLRMATEWLRENGRVGVKKGIIFETDGTPNYNGSSGDPGNYTCSEAVAAANAAKATPNDIEVFVIAFDVTEECPDGSGSWNNDPAIQAMAAMSSSTLSGTACNNAENQDGDHFFCEPAGQDLSAVFTAAAVQLADIRAHLVAIYPAPYVTAISPNGGVANTTVTISGSGFTGATSVAFGGLAGTIVNVASDTSMTVRSPAGTSGQTVHVRVTSPGGTSPTVDADRFTYP